jgi:hypothetical protein
VRQDTQLLLNGRVIEVEGLAEPGPAAVREHLTGPQQQPWVGPGRIGRASARPGFLRQALPNFGKHVVAEQDQMEGIDRDGRAGQPRLRRFAERGRRIDRDNADAEASVQRALEEPLVDALVVVAVDHAEDLPSVEVNGGRHPWPESFPDHGFRVLKNRTDRNPCSLMPRIRGRSLSISGSLAASRARWTSHQEIPWAAAVSVAGRPESIAAEISMFRSRRVELARRGT